LQEEEDAARYRYSLRWTAEADLLIPDGSSFRPLLGPELSRGLHPDGFKVD
jgi:hypothetical protein